MTRRLSATETNSAAGLAGVGDVLGSDSLRPFDQPQREQEDNGAGGGDDKTAELPDENQAQQAEEPTAQQGSDHADHQVADQTKSRHLS